MSRKKGVHVGVPDWLMFGTKGNYDTRERCRYVSVHGDQDNCETFSDWRAARRFANRLRRKMRQQLEAMK